MTTDKYLTNTIGLGIVGLLIYANIAVIFNYLPNRPEKWPKLPITSQLSDQFLLFGVFGFYVNNNIETFVIGEHYDRSWTKLDLSPYVPKVYGKRSSLLTAYKYRHAKGESGQQQALAHLSRAIKKRYNRDNPNNQIKSVIIQQASWPMSRAGFMALRVPKYTKLYTLYNEPMISE